MWSPSDRWPCGENVQFITLQLHFTTATDIKILTFRLRKSTDIYWCIDISLYRSTDISIYRHMLHNPWRFERESFAREVIWVALVVSPGRPETTKIINFQRSKPIGCHVRKTYYLLHFSYILLLPPTLKYQHSGYIATFYCCHRHWNITILATQNLSISWYIDISLHRYTDIPTYSPQSMEIKI
jgi:hypothetical protein